MNNGTTISQMHHHASTIVSSSAKRFVHWHWQAFVDLIFALKEGQVIEPGTREEQWTTTGQVFAEHINVTVCRSGDGDNDSSLLS